MAKRNRLKNTDQENQAPEIEDIPKKKAPKKKPIKKFNLPKNMSFLKDERFHKVAGLLLIMFSIYLLIAFTSFLFTGNADQSILNVDIQDLTEDTKVKNWLGKYGAQISNLFIGKWFGIAAFSFILNFFLIGFFILFKIRLLPFKSTFKYTLFTLLWLPAFLGFIFDESPLLFFGGGIGLSINKWLGLALGSAGSFILIVFVLIGFLMVNFKINLSFKAMSMKDDMVEPQKNSAEVPDEIIATEIASVIHEEVSTPISLDEEEIPDEEIPEPVLLNAEENQPITEPESQPEIQEEAIPKEPVAEVSLNLETENEIEANEPPIPPVVPELEVMSESVVEEDDISTTQEFSLDIPDKKETVTAPSEDLEIEIEKPEVKEDILSESEINKKVEDFGEYDPTLDLSKFQFPSVELLKNYGDNEVTVNREELEANKNKIVDTLRNYKIEISQIKATIGPTVTLYEIVPEAGVRISKIKNLEDDIALSLSALGIRIIAPIPGRGTIGIEVPNKSADIVSMKSLIQSEKFQNSDMALPVALGKTISNETFVADLAKMPHLLMAGATGQGKSVGLNAILVSLLYKLHPSQIKFVLVDPKKVELTLFNKIERHYLAKLPDEEEAIITDTTKVVHTLNSLCIEMDQRYELLKNAMVRNLKEYNTKFKARKLNPEKGHRFLPYIVLVVDEFADLIMTAGKEVETPIARLAQLARAIGIHLIIATQRPSVNVITGIIKANFPARIAFRVTSKIDSRTILDAAGADQLIGRGDMLYTQGNDLVRLQCGFVDTPEVEEITEFIGNQQGYSDALLLPEYVDENSSGPSDIEDIDRDALFEDAARIVVQHQQGSASLLQRRLKLGYNRAGRIVDQLEAAGIIGPFEGSKARQVLVPDEIALEQLLKGND